MFSVLFQIVVGNVFMLNTSMEFFILKLAISEMERALENCPASGV
jgi:hypothetical protein